MRQASAGMVAEPDAVRPLPLVDLRGKDPAVAAALRQAIERVLESEQFILGKEVEACELAIADYCTAKHAVGCASGTDALLLALMALDLGPGCEVITTPYSFFATASVICRVGAKPVFVDIRPDTFNLDEQAVEAAVTPRTRAILPVHLYGQCAQMQPLQQLAAKRGLAIVEDAAQAFGAQYAGRPAGVLGTLGCFSFFPTKNLGALGDAGTITTGDPALARRLRRLRVHGMEPKYYHVELGINSRLDAIQAAVIAAKLPFVEQWTDARRVDAQRYTQLFADYGLLDCVQPPVERPECRHVFNQYVIRVPDGRRDALRDHLLAARIGCEVYYPVPLHLQPCFAHLGYRPGSLPEAERAARESLALPVHPGLTAEAQETVASTIAQFFGRFSPQTHVPLRGPKFLKQASQLTPR